jgi:hypothetical protein
MRRKKRAEDLLRKQEGRPILQGRLPGVEQQA